MSDVIYNKVATIERCLKRIHDVYENNPVNLQDFTKQDSIILNLQRACEASIDIAVHIVSIKKLGLPKTSRDAFELMEQAGYLPSTLAKSLKAMVGFRNIAVHDYQLINLSILQTILEKHLEDFKHYISTILKIK